MGIYSSREWVMILGKDSDAGRAMSSCCDAIDRLKQELLVVRKKTLTEAAEIAERVIERTCWGSDGDCGVSKTIPKAIIAAIEECKP